MSDLAVIEVQLASYSSKPLPGEKFYNKIRGGAEVLLQWLETQLGLLEETASLSSRITQYAAALQQLPDASYANSFKIDRWATAKELLERRGELRLAGWDETDRVDLPELARDMAKVRKKTCKNGNVFLPDLSTRLQRVITALNRGQVLPRHRCILFDPLEQWPVLWREVLQKLNTANATPVVAQASSDSALGCVQKQVLDNSTDTVAPDGTILWLQSRSVAAACEAIAVALSTNRRQLNSAVVCCENLVTALCLDGCLARLGLPTMGATLQTHNHPALQVLPLALKLCWGPVDPAVLLDFLSLPVNPIPRGTSRHLANALMEQPGLGSTAWEDAVKDLCDPGKDQDGRTAKRLKDWFEQDRQPLGEPLPAKLIKKRCDLVASWAGARASILSNDKPRNLELLEALRVVAKQACDLGELAEVQGEKVSEPQLAHLLDTVCSPGIEVEGHLEAENGPLLVTSLAEIKAPCSRLVWLGLGTEHRARCRWSALELQQFKNAGVDLDDSSHELTSIRKAEKRGFCQVKEALLAVSLPGDEELRLHPLWQQISGILTQEDTPVKPLPLEQLLTESETRGHKFWSWPTSKTIIQPPQPQRSLWTVGEGLLQDRSSSSATELTTRLACPLQWVFNYNARLKPSPVGSLPSSFLLKGNFCHSVLATVFGAKGSVPKDAVDKVAKMFDKRLPFDAAPLAQPSLLSDKFTLRKQLLTATETLVEILNSGGYSVQGLEVPIEAEVEGRQLDGYVDCLVEREKGQEAIIDFKYMGGKKYPALLEEGRAVQLATYAYARSQANQGVFPAVGYLILAEGILYTLKSNHLYGEGQIEYIEGKDVSNVWEDFMKALRETDSWLTGNEPVPARPLQNAEDRPSGVAMVIDEPRSNQSKLDCDPCK